MLFLALCSIFFIIVSVQGAPSPQSPGAIVVPTIDTSTGASTDDSQNTNAANYRQRVSSQDSTGDSQVGYSSGRYPPGGNSRQQGSNAQGLGRGNIYQPTSNTRYTSQRAGYEPTDSTTSSSPQTIIKSHQTCGTTQPAADKGTDKIGQPCTSFDAPGTYQPIDSCPMGMSEAGDYSKDAYPTSNGIQCCATKSCAPPSTTPDGDSINPTQYVGKCMNKHKGANCAYYKGFYVENLCPGPFTIQCCILPKENLPDSLNT